MSIKIILESLKPCQRDQLMYAFEQGWTQIIEYKPGHFIGVHVPDREKGWSAWKLHSQTS
jgi:hypothetical protein